MKFRNTITLMAVGLAVCLGATGCKKRTQNVTPLPGYEPSAAGSGTGLEPGEGMEGGGVTGENLGPGSTGVPQTADYSTWSADRTIFAEQTVYFEFDKSAVRPSEVPKLETVASRMTAFPDRALRVEGHCDERGTEEYNRALGERRALAVREFLVGLGLEPHRIETVSFGEDRPVDPGHSSAAWAKNRRAEILLLSPPR